MLIKWSNNNASSIHLLSNEWINLDYRSKLKEKILFLAHDEKCWKLTSKHSQREVGLMCNNEETFTRLLLQANHATSNGFQNAFLVSDNTDVLLLENTLQNVIECGIIQRRGSSSKSRPIRTGGITSALGENFASALPCYQIIL